MAPLTTLRGCAADAITAARAVGYPVLIKATGGGGGMGIHKCFSDGEVSNFFPLAVSQGKKNFGNGDVFIEKYIERAKHIEVQARPWPRYACGKCHAAAPCRAASPGAASSTHA